MSWQRLARAIAGLIALAPLVCLAPSGCAERRTRHMPAEEGDDAPASGAGEQGMVPLMVTLPRPGFIMSTWIREAMKEAYRPHPRMLVPAGTANVALGKPVTSSDQHPTVGKLEMVTDGEKEVERLGREYVELHPGPQYVQIDLEAQHRLVAVVVWHYRRAPMIYRDVVVQVAADADFITGVRTLYNSDRDNTLGLGFGEDAEYYDTYLGRFIDAGGVEARHVRLYSNGTIFDDHRYNHYVEVEVYGVPVR